MRIDILSIFPEYFSPLDVSLIGKARQRGVLDVRVHDLRQWAYDRHRTVDDTPYGGGPGMVMKPEPWGEALDTIAPPSPPMSSASSSDPVSSAPASDPVSSASSSDSVSSVSASDPGFALGSRPDLEDGSTSESRPGGGSGSSAPCSEPSSASVTPRLVIPTPSGRPFTQALAVAYAAEPWLIFGCGRYEGIDSRVAEEARTRMPVDEVSIGDYVLAGGEAAVLVMIEAIGRLLPGVLGNAESVVDDSFAPGRMETLLEGPIYTKPPVWRDRAVPQILFSGHHAQIARWRRDEALRRTAAHRPELLERLDPEALDARDREVLDARDREVLDETRPAES